MIILFDLINKTVIENIYVECFIAFNPQSISLHTFEFLERHRSHQKAMIV